MENNNQKEKIHVEDETVSGEKEQTWTEEFVVAGEALLEKVKGLVHEAAVRRLVIKNEARNIHFEVPLTLGVAGIAMMPAYAALALIALLVVDCTIMVERRVIEEKPEAVVKEG